MNFIDTLGFITISFLLVRVIILIKIDSQRKRNIFFKFLFGGYAFEAMIPRMRKPESDEEATWVKLANICLVVFYALFLTLLLTIWFKYRNPGNNTIPNENKPSQATLSVEQFDLPKETYFFGGPFLDDIG